MDHVTTKIIENAIISTKETLHLVISYSVRWYIKKKP